MSAEAINKIKQTHSQFKKITANLNKLLDLQFGYMKVFKDASYYKIMDDLNCLVKFVTNVKKSHIFCERNVTNYFDDDYNFTLWPKAPHCTAMEVYDSCGIWNGITVSKIHKDNIELYWFNGGTNRDDWHKFFIRNKPLLLRFIKYFDENKEEVLCLEENSKQKLFKFKQGFDIGIQKSEYIEEESDYINKLVSSLNISPKFINNTQKETKLSRRESEVLAIIGQGYSLKIAANDLQISYKTAQYYLEQIKLKTQMHFKSDLIKLYQKLI